MEGEWNKGKGESVTIIILLKNENFSHKISALSVRFCQPFSMKMNLKVSLKVSQYIHNNMADSADTQKAAKIHGSTWMKGPKN